MEYRTTAKYTKKGLIHAVTAAKENPDLDFVFSEFGLYEKTSAAFLRWFRECLNAKINRNMAFTGRKHDDEYQRNLMLDAFRIRDYRNGARSSGSRGFLRTPEMQKRFPHINNQERDF